MRLLRILIITVCFSAIIAGIALAAEINVNVAVKIGGPDKPSNGSGGFTIDEGTYGRVSFTFPENTDNFRVTSWGGRQGPVTRVLGKEKYSSFSENDIILMTDLYLKPSITTDRKIRVTGVMINLTKSGKSKPGLFAYSEEKFDIVLPDVGTSAVKLDTGIPGKEIYLDISAKSTEEMSYKPSITRDVLFESEYSLYNENTKKYELKNCRVILGFAVDDSDAKGTAFNKKVFLLPDNDSLLFTNSFEINKPRWNRDNTLTFDFEVIHIYSINPENTPAFPWEIKSEKTTMIISSKEITVSPGERTEIEIPAPENSLLPFKSKEIIVLTNNINKTRR